MSIRKQHGRDAEYIFPSVSENAKDTEVHRFQEWNPKQTLGSWNNLSLLHWFVELKHVPYKKKSQSWTRKHLKLEYLLDKKNTSPWMLCSWQAHQFSYHLTLTFYSAPPT